MTWSRAVRVFGRRGSAWIVAAALLLASTALVGLGLRGGDHPLAAPSPSLGALRAAAPEAPEVQALAADRSVPLTLTIPAIGIAVAVGSLGINEDGTVQVPRGTAQPGWFRLGP